MAQLLPLHGAVGYWDEIACLAIPLTVIVGIALAVLRPKLAAPVDTAERHTPDREDAHREHDGT